MSGKPWNKALETKMLALHEYGFTYKKIGEKLDRSESSIRFKMSMLSGTFVRKEEPTKPVFGKMLHADGSLVVYTDSPHARAQPIRAPYIRANY